jgi:hypothetical protein
MCRNENKSPFRILALPDTSSVCKSSPFLSEPFPNLRLHLLQLVLRFRAQLQLLREPLSKEANKLIDPPSLLHAQEEGCSGRGIYAVLGRFLVTEPPPPHKSGQAKAKDEGIKAQDPDIVLALDELNGDSNSHGHFLATVGVTVLLVVFTNGFVGESEFRN